MSEMWYVPIRYGNGLSMQERRRWHRQRRRARRSGRLATGGSFTWVEPQGGCIIPALGPKFRAGELVKMAGTWRPGEAPTLTITLDNTDATFTPTGPRYEFGTAQAATTDDNAGG